MATSQTNGWVVLRRKFKPLRSFRALVPARLHPLRSQQQKTPLTLRHVSDIETTDLSTVRRSIILCGMLTSARQEQEGPFIKVQSSSTPKVFRGVMLGGKAT